MSNINIFLKTYWQHAKSTLDFALFITSVVALIFGTQVTLAIPLGVALMFAVVIIAAYRTWLYQYRQTQEVVGNKEKEIEYKDLNEIQQAILYGMSTEADKKIISIGAMGGVVFTGIGSVGNEHDGSEIEAEITELEKTDILRIDTYNKSGRPVYKPTSLGFRILKQIEETKNGK